MKARATLSIAIAAACLLLTLPAPAQTSPSNEAPDLRGIWQVEGTANVNLEGHPAQDGFPAGESVVVDPANRLIPYRADALDRRRANFARRGTLDPQAACFQPGLPRAAYVPEPFQIFQTPGRVFIVYQHVHAYRVIFTDGRPHYDGIEFYMGDSRGHWEGDTLVVDARNFKPETWLDMSGNYHSDALHVVERYTRTGDDTMNYEATIEDPKVFTAPWTIRLNLRRHAEPGFQLVEHECERDKDGKWHHPPPFGPALPPPVEKPKPE